MNSALIQIRQRKIDDEIALRVQHTKLMRRVADWDAMTPQQRKEAPKENMPTPEERKEEERSRSRIYSARAEQDLERAYYALGMDLERLVARLQLGYGEAGLIVDICNGWKIAHPAEIDMLVRTIDEAAQHSATTNKWRGLDPQFDPQAFAIKLRGLTFMEKWALVDAAERFWASGSYHISDVRERLQDVGLLCEESIEGGHNGI